MKTITVNASTYTLEAPADPANIVNSGVQLRVDYTATGACAITLPEISTLGPSTAFRVTVADTGLQSATNNISITAGGSDKINNASSVKLASNGANLILEVTGGTDWVSINPQGGLTAVTATATADGTGTGAIANGNCIVTVTSANANNIITLPPAVPGTIVKLINGATGYELRTTSPTTIAINGGVGSAAESAIAASTNVVMECFSETTWIGSTYTAAGVKGVVEVAAP